MAVTITCPANESTGLCSLLNEVGAGTGIFLQYMGVALPFLIVILGVIGGVIAIFFAIAHLIKNNVARSYHSR